MDGLLIDSEPLWQEAGAEMLNDYNIVLTDEQYRSSTGLRTPEWIDHWFGHFGIPKAKALETSRATEDNAIEKIRTKGKAMPGVKKVMDFFKERNFRIGLASSSPMRLIEMVTDQLQLRNYIDIFTSAEKLAYGKPHPQVFIECADALKAHPRECVVFEDSFNGMIAAKAAKMKCVVVPHGDAYNEARWAAADLRLKSLEEFGEKELVSL